MAALGKGLGSLIPNKIDKENEDSLVDDNAIVDAKKIQYIPLSKIKANPWQPRNKFDREKLQELADSIKQHGILQPLVISKESKGYQIIAGERRFRAAELLKLKEIPAIVRDATDRDKLELSIIENIQRHDLNPMEEAGSYKRLMEEFGMDLTETSKAVGKSKGNVSIMVRLLSLPIVIKEAIEEGKISLSHARLIMNYPTKMDQIKIFKEILKNDLTVKDLKSLNDKARAKIQAKKPRDPIITSWEDKITKSVGAKTNIDKKGEKGTIKIKFFSHEELKNILDKLV